MFPVFPLVIKNMKKISSKSFFTLTKRRSHHGLIHILFFYIFNKFNPVSFGELKEKITFSNPRKSHKETNHLNKEEKVKLRNRFIYSK